MWLYIFVIFGALVVVAALAVTGLGLPIAIVGGLVIAGALFLVLASRMTTAVDDADSESSKPSWLKKHYYE
jgi:MFS superfamily sulfate permease-like transporter